MSRAALLGAAVLALCVSSGAEAAENPLRVIAVDVEGGTATLIVTPQGQSVLIDAGWPDGLNLNRNAKGAPPRPPPPTSSDRVLASARMMGLTRIDYLVTTHYHLDHVGGVIDLIGKIPIGVFVDHGPNREVDTAAAKARGPYSPPFLYDAYRTAIAGKPHRTMKAGDRLKIGDLVLTAVDSDRQPGPPLPGAGGRGVGCDKAAPHIENDEIENQHSLGFLATYGHARVLMLADQVWNVENELVCPIDRIGPVDVLFVNNHGTDTSTSPVFIDTVNPTVMIMGNSATKGGNAPTLKTLAPRAANLWQLHFAIRSPDDNAPEAQIANLEPTPYGNWPLHLNVLKSGAVTVINTRNGFSKSYAPRPAAAGARQRRGGAPE